MLREPVARVLSHYFYHKTEVRDPNHKVASEMTLDEWWVIVRSLTLLFFLMFICVQGK